VEITDQDVVLDGHARLRAARELGIADLAVQILRPPDELEHIVRAALLRRQLSASQRAVLALKLLPFEDLREQAQRRQRANLRAAPEVATLPARSERTRDLIAELAGTGARTAQDVITIHEHDPDLLKRVMEGKVAAHTAASAVRRAHRDASIAPAPPLPCGPFELILVDPPWQFGSPDSTRAPEQHYPTMSLEEIKAMKLPAADDCVLFLWAVNALLREALEVIEDWGFRYRSHIAWVKPSIGAGVWLRQRHEPLLLATKGEARPPEPSDRCESVIEAPRGRHSEKPLAAYELIERMYPQRCKLELFARGSARSGWVAWGNEVEA
jgi:N6-adenosine-specific RNA methylase IME4